MHKVLETIIDLQEIDAKLLRLEQSKGDLPAKVKDFSSQVDAVREQLQQKINERDAAVSEKKNADLEIETIKARLEKYKSQLYQVKTNREYDAITLEMETAQKAKYDMEYRIEELEEQLKTAQEELAELEATLKEQEAQLALLRDELARRQELTQEEETQLLARLSEILARVPKAVLSSYERIRQARGGYAVAMLRHGACSQCNSRIPPQRGLEIRMMNRINLCEVCGRILVWKAEEES